MNEPEEYGPDDRGWLRAIASNREWAAREFPGFTLREIMAGLTVPATEDDAR